MNTRRLQQLLSRYKNGRISQEKVLDAFAASVSEDLGFATVDHHREMRQGFPEVILCEGKTPAQVVGIARRIVGHGSILLATRAGKEHASAIRKAIPRARYNPAGRVVVANEQMVMLSGEGTILVVTAGTSDIPVAEEAIETARLMGNRVEQIFDVGVAGIHRVLAHSEELRRAAVVIVIAGMEGALASVVGGLVRAPVIAVPTSVGYGANFKGLSALLGMLNSCAAGVTVVNIDNGFGAAFAASLINRKRRSGG